MSSPDKGLDPTELIFEQLSRIEGRQKELLEIVRRIDGAQLYHDASLIVIKEHVLRIDQLVTEMMPFARRAAKLLDNKVVKLREALQRTSRNGV